MLKVTVKLHSIIFVICVAHLSGIYKSSPVRLVSFTAAEKVCEKLIRRTVQKE